MPATLSLPAARLYHTGQIHHLRLDSTQNALVLDDWALIQNDADGCGYPLAWETLTPGTTLRKILMIDSPPNAPVAREAVLLIHHIVPPQPPATETQSNSAPTPAAQSTTPAPPPAPRIAITLNGRALQATLHPGFNSIPLDPAFLRPGPNEIVLAAVPDSPPAVINIADRETIIDNAPWRRTEPPQSSKSTDAGRSWSTALGDSNQAAGEYEIRLRLRRFAPAGTYESPILDLADPDRQEPVKKLAAIHSLLPRLAALTPPGTAVTCFLRTGSTPVFNPAAWDDFRPLTPNQPLYPRGRYAQLKCLLTTNNPLATPALQSLTFDITADHPASPTSIQIDEYKSFPIIRSSLPFTYEPLNHPELRRLRQHYHLDDAVRGAATQLETVAQLAHWVAQQWHWHIPHDYPEWNAFDILQKLPSGESRGGFCGQYAIVMVQCCLALGIQARFVFAEFPGVGGGHEVVEFWSDEFCKWILVDPNQDRYFIDPLTRIPVNALEVHQAFLKYAFTGDAIGTAAHNKALFDAQGLEGFLKQGPQIVHGGHFAGPPHADFRTQHFMWGFPHMMPRNNFFSQPRPIPKRHGYGVWSWHGYFHWFDAQTPRQDLFTLYTDRLSDWYWNLHQVDLHVEHTTDPNLLRITLETFTPQFDTFLISIDGAPFQPSPAEFLWPLHPGPNALQAKVRTQYGAEGPPSLLRLTAQTEP